MANEITVSARLQAIKASGPDFDRGYGSLQFTLTGNKSVSAIQSIGTSAEALAIGEIGTCGWAIFENMDTTNYITIRAGSGAADVIKLKAGEIAVFRLASSTPYALANTAACLLRYTILED